MALPPYLPTLQASSTKNLIRDDNFFASEGALGVLSLFSTQPEHQTANADHFPIETMLEIPTSHVPLPQRRNFHKVDWDFFQRDLNNRLSQLSSSHPITDHSSFDNLLSDLYKP
jgi:hypothetical protein